MTNTSVSRPGQIGLAGDALALFLKVFSGEVLTAFDRDTVMKNLHRMRTIKSGKSAQFPALGRAVAKRHVAGENILDVGNGYLNLIPSNERVIAIDNLLLAPCVIQALDEAMNHYDVRSDYSNELGHALAQAFDRTTLQVAVLAARAAANFAGSYPAGTGGGTVITTAAMDTNAAVLLAALKTAAQTFDEKDVPSTDRHVIIPPKLYWNLVDDKSLVNRDNNADGGNGLFYTGKIYMAYGMALHMSNNVPNSNVAAGTGENNTYSGDFTKTKGVVFHKSAIGTVKLLDLAFEQEYKIEVQGTLMVAKYAMGHGILRPECAIELAIP